MLKFVLSYILCFNVVINAAVVPGYRKGMPSGYWYYKLHTIPRTWNDATLVCQSEKSQLAIINSADEAKLFVNEMNKYPPVSLSGDFNKDMVAIGLHRRLGDGKFVSWDGTPMEETGYTRWFDNQPDNSGGHENCGAMLRNGKINDVPCDTPMMFICETANPFKGETVHHEPQCESYEHGYKLGLNIAGDRFYKFHTDPKTWDEASLICQIEGAKLAVINSEEEAQLYVEEMESHPPHTLPGDFTKNVAMLGFHDRIKSGKFTTMDGHSLKHSGYDEWSPGKPDATSANHDCGGMMNNGMLTNVPCTEKLTFFCEKPYIKSSKLSERTMCGRRRVPDEELTKGLECQSYKYGYKKNTVESSDKKYFKLHRLQKTWDEALLKCQSEQATLAIITSEREAKMYAEELSANPASAIPGSFNKDVVMMGFHDRLISGNYITVNGNSLSKSGYFKWSTGQPDNSSDRENCGAMQRSGLLSTIRCNVPLMFFCEKNLDESCSKPQHFK